MKLLYCDASLIAVDKPGGLLAVPGRGPAGRDCVVSRLRRRFPDLPPQPAVHRLDMATSGILLLARTATAHRALCRQFERRAVSKKYLAVLAGMVAGESGRIELRFRLDPENRPYQIFDPVHGKPGITLWRKIASADGCTRVEFTPLTGRTHQLRLHAADPHGLGCPVVGDSLYGSGARGERMLLHAAELTILHPETGRPLHLISPPPF